MKTIVAILLTGILSSPFVQASNALKITSITGTSNSDLGDGTDTPTIYGGFVGPLQNECATPSANSTCNNCVWGPEVACNEKRIHSQLKLRINFDVTANI